MTCPDCGHELSATRVNVYAGVNPLNGTYIGLSIPSVFCRWCGVLRFMVKGKPI